MDDALAKKVVLVLMLTAAWGLIALIRKLWRSPTEGARRLKLVLAVAIALVVSAFLIEGMGVAGFAVTLAVLGTLAWVYKGFKK